MGKPFLPKAPPSPPDTLKSSCAMSFLLHHLPALTRVYFQSQTGFE